METFIHQSAKIKNSEYGVIKAFRNTCIISSKINDYCSIGDDTTIERTILEGHSAINRRSYINDSFIGAYTYTGINTTINFAKIGRFCSIGRNVDIGGFDHDYRKITTMSYERFMQLNGNSTYNNSSNSPELCQIGNDVWIAAGAQILHSANVGDGAVIGAGAVVTHDVPSYAIVAGVPARVIGYRCDKKYIDALMNIKWWNMPLKALGEYGKKIIEMDISEKSIKWLAKIVEEHE